MKYTSNSNDWKELALCREIYGLLQALVSRPFSCGHDGALSDATSQLTKATKQLGNIARNKLTDSQLHLLQDMIKQLDTIPAEVVARTLIGALGHIVSQAGMKEPNLRCCFLSQPRVHLNRLVVLMGPTIGLGDEILAARALIERAAQFTNLSLCVSSHHFELWQCQAAQIVALDPPPLGAFQFIEDLDRTERAETGFLFIDFLDTDRSSRAYSGPPGIAFGGRWSMGLRQTEFSDVRTGMHYRSRYPDGLPECRWLEARWMAARALPCVCGNGAFVKKSTETFSSNGKEVLLQPLTAKPQLMFPADFYGEVIERVKHSVSNLTVKIIPGPTPRSQSLIAEILKRVRCVCPQATIEDPESISLQDVHNRLKRTHLLFGPDTFTAHLAAILGIPQVTISLPEHRSWRTTNSPCLGIVADRPSERLISACAKSIVAYLDKTRWSEDPAFAADARRWCSLIHDIDEMIKQFLQLNQYPSREEVATRVEEMRSIYSRRSETVHRILDFSEPIAECQPFDAFEFVEEGDLVRALARWFQASSLTEVSSIFAAI